MGPKLAAVFWEEDRVNADMAKMLLRSYRQVAEMASMEKISLREAAYTIAVARGARRAPPWDVARQVIPPQARNQGLGTTRTIRLFRSVGLNLLSLAGVSLDLAGSHAT